MDNITNTSFLTALATNISGAQAFILLLIIVMIFAFYKLGGMLGVLGLKVKEIMDDTTKRVEARTVQITDLTNKVNSFKSAFDRHIQKHIRQEENLDSNLKRIYERVDKIANDVSYLKGRLDKLPRNKTKGKK